MGLLDQFLGLFGYEKAQVKPRDTTNTSGYEKDRVLEPEKLQDDVLNDKIEGFPGNFCKDVSDTTKNINERNEEQVQRYDEEKIRLDTPEDLNNSELSTIRNIPQDNSNLEQIHVRPILDIEEITKLNRSIATKMEKLGILQVDKRLFLARYNELLKEAALQRKPISEVLDAFF